MPARARYLRARVLAERGELDAAIGLIGQARAGWWAAGQRLSALRTDLGRMQALDDLGRHREAAAARRDPPVQGAAITLHGNGVLLRARHLPLRECP